MGGLSVRAGWLAVLLVTGWLAAGCGGVFLLDGMTPNEVGGTRASVVTVRVCDPANPEENPACIPCNDASKKGLILVGKMRTKCDEVEDINKCKSDRSEVRWAFEDLAKGEKFRGTISYVAEPTEPASGPAYPGAYCYEKGGICEAEGNGNGPGKNAFSVLSQRANLKSTDGALEFTHWPYRVDLALKTGKNKNDWTLIACADPEIIVTPPRGVAPPAAEP